MVFPVVIENEVAIDGTGATGRRLDVGLIGDRIVDVAHLSAAPPRTRIDARGHVVGPGFVDVHCHSELALLRHRRALPSVTLGVTTVILGNDGISYATASADTVIAVGKQWSAVGGPVPDGLVWSLVRDMLVELDGRVGVNIAYSGSTEPLRLTAR